jgi:hypothetical protein
MIAGPAVGASQQVHNAGRVAVLGAEHLGRQGQGLFKVRNGFRKSALLVKCQTLEKVGIQLPPQIFRLPRTESGKEKKPQNSNPTQATAIHAFPLFICSSPILFSS